MESKIKETYENQFLVEFVGTWHEFGKIYGFTFYVIENNDYPIAVEYNLGNQTPLEFDKQRFEKEYEGIKIKVRASESLEKDIQVYYPNVRAIADRIENRDGTFRWVNNIYTAQPLDREKEKTFVELNILCKSLAEKLSEKKAFYNFYFPKEIDSTKYTDNRFSFFEFDNFSQKHIHHYRVDLIKSGEQFEVTNQKLYDNLKEEQSEKLKDSIMQWKNENGFKNWEISLLTENNIDRDLNLKKFMLDWKEEKKFGFINLVTGEIIFEE